MNNSIPHVTTLELAKQNSEIIDPPFWCDSILARRTSEGETAEILHRVPSRGSARHAEVKPNGEMPASQAKPTSLKGPIRWWGQ